jgi:hypothetical protein
MQTTNDLVQQDWTPQNLIGIQRALRLAYNSVADVCDPKRHPFFDTPNRIYAVGYNRWLVVDYYLLQACQAGWFQGISAHWVSLGGKAGTPLSVLELRGMHTSVLALHLRQPDELPRDSGYRYDQCVRNEKHPLLTGFIDPYETEQSKQLLNLLLVHGDKDAEFAELRVYDDPDNRASYTSFTQNIMAGTALPASNDSEIVPEPSIVLVQGVADQKKPSTGA